MAKKTKRRAAAREENDHLGCMWGFMNMFNFRHGPLCHKLHMDQNDDAGNTRNNELDKSKKYAQETGVGEERNIKITVVKPSVKKLIAEELSIHKEIKKQRENAEAGQLSDSELEGRRRKNQRRKHKTRMKSCDNFSHIRIDDGEETQVHRRNHRYARSVDIDNMIDEFYSEVNRRSSTSRANKEEDYKEKLRELISFLTEQKLLHGNHRRGNSEILTSKDLMEVFQILGSDEELFLKLLQDPEILVPREKRAEQSSLADKKWSSFFRRKDAPEDECEASDRIFLLKPRSASFSTPDRGNCCGLSPDSHLMRNKFQNERNSSHFFFSEIKRKLKHAIKKEQPAGGFGKCFPITKDHFFFEPIAKPKSQNEDDKKQKVSNIYTEAKRHLSEMLNNGDLDSKSTSRHVQRSLGGILSSPEYLSPRNSPGRIWEKNTTAHKKSSSADYINLVNIKKETHASQPEENADIQIFNISKEPENHIQPTSEPTEKSVDIENGTANEEKISSEANLSESADEVMIINEIDVVPEETSCTLVGDLPKVEAHDEQRDSINSEKTSPDVRQPSLSSSEASPSHCLGITEECKSAMTDLPEWSSPISKVESWCIHFDEKDSAAINLETSITSDKELVFKYVKAVLEAVDSDLQELYLKSQFSDQLLEPALISNIPFSPNQICPDHELLFDSINEALMELCCSPPWASFVSHRTRVFSAIKSIIHEVQQAVYWHLLPLPLPHALDQIVSKDMAKAANWLDIRCDIDCIGFETSELILDELLEELTLNSLNKNEQYLVPPEMKTDGNTPIP